MTTKAEFKVNLKNSIQKIKSLIYASETNFNSLEISVIDMDYNENTNDLYMVLIEIKFYVETEQTFDEFITTCQMVRSKLNNLLSKISFDDNGNLKSTKTPGGIFYNAEGLVSKIEASHNNDEVYFELDFMFTD